MTEAVNELEHAAHHLPNIPEWAMIPFILMLGAIAVLPLVAHKFWEENRNKLIVSLILGVPTAIYLIVFGMQEPVVSHKFGHVMIYEYVPFIILLGGLFVISGGIFVSGNIAAKPGTNTIMLAIGAILASFMGTTGAAMLLIRPVIKTNSERKHKVHTILFFIATVANCGGLLTPLGDPPLFMMYLRGAEFFWFFNFVKEWALMNFLILGIYYFVDKYYYSKEFEADIKIDEHVKEPVRIHGKQNFLFLIGVVLAVAFINPNTMSFIRSETPISFLREGVIVLMAILSLRFTRQKIRIENRYSWEPIVEVIYLFLGIFITMTPCLLYLEKNGAELLEMAHRIGVENNVFFYYATGILSSFLDNTPTAVTFHALAHSITDPAAHHLVAGVNGHLLEAICVSSVFFGAMTYIGNGPNFMVKAIAENSGIKMPDFFSYMIKFSLIVLLPLYVVIQLIFI